MTIILDGSSGVAVEGTTGYTSQTNGLGAGLVPAEQIYRLDTAYAGTNSSGAQSIFGVGVTLVGSTVYQFELCFAIYKTAGATSHTTSLLFGGTATINNIMYSGPLGNLAATSPASGFDSACSDVMVFVSTATAVTGSSTVAAITKTFNLKGTVSIGTGGTFIPQYSSSAAPGGAYTTTAGSYFKISPLSASGANTNIGTWA